jgi:hypothetical protein
MDWYLVKFDKFAISLSLCEEDIKMYTRLVLQNYASFLAFKALT